MQAGRSATRWRDHGLAATVHGVVTLVFFFPVWAQGRAYSTDAAVRTLVAPWSALTPGPLAGPVQVDQAVLSSPWHASLTEALRSGTLPLWGKELGGYPRFADAASGQLYPPRLLLALLGFSPSVAHDLFSMLHVFAAGFFLYLFLRALDLSALPATFGGVVWMACGWHLAWLHNEALSPVVALLPFMTVLGYRAVRRQTVASALAFGLSLGITLAAGQLPIMVVACTVAGGYAGALVLAASWRAWRRGGRTAAARSIVLLLVSAVVGLMAAAVVLAPTAVALQDTTRSPLTYEQLDDPWVATEEPMTMSPAALVRLFVPDTQGIDLASINGRELFVGTITVLLAVVGMGRRRHARAAGLGIAGTVAAVACGGPVTWVAFHVYPVLHFFRPYGRASFAISFGVIVLAAAGLEDVLALVRPEKAVGRGETETSTARRIVTSRAAHVAAAITVVTVAQLVVYGRSVNPPFPPRNPEHLLARTPMIRALEAHQAAEAWPRRGLGIASETAAVSTLCCDIQDLFAISLINGYDSSVPQRTVTRLRYLEGASLEEAQQPLQLPLLPRFPASDVRYELLGRFGVSVLATDRSLPLDGGWGGEARGALQQSSIYTGSDGNLIGVEAPPALRVVRQVVVADGAGDALATFTQPSHPWEDTAVLEADQLSRSPQARGLVVHAPPAAGPAAPATLRGTGGINTRRVHVDTPVAGLLVLPESWDRGWTATVDGRPAPVLRANFDQQAIAVPAGRSTVRLRYRPVHFVAGAATSTAAFVGTGVAGCVGAVARRRQRAERRNDR